MITHQRAFQVVIVVKNPPANAGDVRDAGLIPGLGRSPGGGHGKPLQYSCLENSMNRGAWRATVHWVAISRTWFSHLNNRLDKPWPSHLTILDLSCCICETGTVTELYFLRLQWGLRRYTLTHLAQSRRHGKCWVHFNYFYCNLNKADTARPVSAQCLHQLP